MHSTSGACSAYSLSVMALLGSDAFGALEQRDQARHRRRSGLRARRPRGRPGVGDGAISDAARPYLLRFDRQLGCVSVEINKSDPAPRRRRHRAHHRTASRRRESLGATLATLLGFRRVQPFVGWTASLSAPSPCSRRICGAPPARQRRTPGWCFPGRSWTGFLVAPASCRRAASAPRALAHRRGACRAPARRHRPAVRSRWRCRCAAARHRRRAPAA